MTPIVVMQMGKVGSRSIVDSLERHYSDGPIFHVHALRRESLDTARQRFEEAKKPLPDHLRHSEEVLALLDRGAQFKVITLTREPISRNISAFFQRLSDEGRSPTAPTPALVSELIEEFQSSQRHGVATGWFDNQFHAGLGIDVYEHPFSFQTEFQTYETTNVSALLLRTEAADSLKAEQIGAFLETDGFALRRSNDSSTKGYAATYAAFKEAIVLEARYVNRMLNSRYSQHFYSEKERRKVRHFWRLRRQAAESSNEG